MRWLTKRPEPKVGDIRRRNKFAFLPTKVDEYTVWLESYQVTEEYKAMYDFQEVSMMWIEVSRRTLEYYGH
jgi:hypothetical protein